MEVVTRDKITIVSLTEEDSSFVNMICYDEEDNSLFVDLKGIGERHFKDVPNTVFINFMTSPSIGAYYNNHIKQKFKFMSTSKKQTQQPQQQEPVVEKNKPKKINRSDPENFRWINGDINLSKIDKSWLRKGKDSGDLYLDFSMRMQPEGQVDQFGKLAMITQTVPSDIFRADKTARGAIIGNAEQLEWGNNNHEEEKTSVTNSDFEDLPF